MKAKSPIKTLAVVCFLFLLSCRMSSAQTFYGSIVGTVTDTSGSLIPDARVTLMNLGTAERRVMQTNTAGIYEFVNLLPGKYRVEVEKTGFKRFAREPITVEVQQSVRIDVVGMEVGAVSETVEVKAETPLLQPETSSLGQVVESRKVNELPLNGRNPLALVALVPGVVPQGTVGGGALMNPAGQNPFAAGNFQIGGGASNQSAAFWDGSPLNNVYNNNLSITPAQDSIQEFKVQTNSLSAEFGRFSGGVINLSTKSGTNAYHGTLYEFLRNKVLNANTFFNNIAGVPTPAFTQNQFGGAIGGPVAIPHAYNGRNKLFFFTNLERYSQRLGYSGTFTVPTLAERNGDFSGLRGANGAVVPIYDPTTTQADPARSGFYTRIPFANNTIPQSRIDPAGRYLSNHVWGAPNTTGNPLTNISNWAGNTNAGADSTEFTTRVDANLGTKQTFFARYTLWSTNLLPIDPFGTGVYPIQVAPQQWWNQQVVLNHSYSLSPTTIFNLHASFLRQNVNQQPQSSGFDLSQLGWPASANNAVTFRVLPFITVPGMQSLFGEGSTVIRAKVNDYSLAPSINRVFGRHSLKAGGDVRIGQYNYVQASAASGTFSFDTGFTTADPLHPAGGFGLASMVLGYPAGGSLTTTIPVAGQQIYRALYVQDDIHLTKRLTLNAGMRWEQSGPWSERYNRLSFFMPNAVSPLAQQTGMNVIGRLGLVDSPDRDSRNNINLYNKQFGPRIGLAYQLAKNTVIRTGFGIFWLPQNFIGAMAPQLDPVATYVTPYVASTDGNLTPAGRLSNPFPSGILPPAQRSPNFQSLLYGLSLAPVLNSNPYSYAQQWNFNIQQQLGGGFLLDVAYAGSRGVHLPVGTFLGNQLAPQYMSMGASLLQSVKNPFYGFIQNGTLANPTVTQSQLLRPYPQYNAINLAGRDAGDSIYHSFQLKLEKRFGAGGSLLASYTNAKLISNVDSATAWLEVGNSIFQNDYDLRSERSLSIFDVPQRLVVSYVLDLPFGYGKKFLGGAKGVAGKLCSGWGLDGVFTAQRGFPLFITAAQNLANAFAGASRPNVNGDPNLAGTGSRESRLNKWFNTAVFTQPAAFTFGNSPRSLPNVRADGIANLDFALFKKTTFGPEGKLSMQFRTEVFNLLNHPQFGCPGQVFGNAQFGIVSSQNNQPRLIQFALRFAF